jgi:hypothetical protein
MLDPDIINVFHAHTFIAIGIKNKIYDEDFLMAVVELLNEHGIAITLSEVLGKAMSHFLASIKYNMTG